MEYIFTYFSSEHADLGGVFLMQTKQTSQMVWTVRDLNEFQNKEYPNRSEPNSKPDEPAERLIRIV